MIIQIYKLFILLYYGNAVCGLEYLQERAVVDYFNANYVSEVSVFTGRVKRGEPYLTNASVLILYPVANNVSLKVIYEMKKGLPFQLTIKLCDMLKHQWIMDFINQYSEMQLECPLKPGLYKFWKVELPPKNLPLLLPKNDYKASMVFFKTVSKEVVLKMSMQLHYIGKKKGKDKDKDDS